MKELQDTSDEDNSKSDDTEVNGDGDNILTQPTTTPRIVNQNSTSNKASSSIGTDLIQHATDLEQDMDMAMKALSDPEDEVDDANDKDDFTPLIQHILNQELTMFS